MKTGSSDINLRGNLSNYIPYIFDEKTVYGSLALNSAFINVNELMGDEEETTEETDTTSLTIFEVPANIDFSLKTSISRILFDNLDIRNLNGSIIIKDQKAELNNLSMNMLEGSMVMNGEYNTQNILEPKVDFSLAIKGFDIPSTFNAFNTVSQFAPVAKSTQGNFSMGIDFTSNLGEDMMPILPSIFGAGNFSSNKVVVSGSNMFEKLGDLLKNDKFRKLELNDVNFDFEIKDGRVYLDPFEVNIGNMKTLVAGDQGLDQTMNYILSLQVPKKEFGGTANSVLSDLTSKAKSQGINIESSENINIDALNNWKLKPGKKSGKKLKNRKKRLRRMSAKKLKK